MITVGQLKEMKDGQRFATGVGTYPELHREEIRWVAVRGKGYFDWCIYYHFSFKKVEYITQSGDKIFSEEIIKRLVPCDDEAYGLYRR